MAPHEDEASRAPGLGRDAVTNRDARPGVLQRVKQRHGVLGAAGYAFILSAVVLATAGCVGLAVHLPWLFPSLGPTVMLFFESPDQPSARPINTLIGHLVGVGVGCLAVFGLMGQPSAPIGGLTGGYVAAGALSVAGTTLILTLLHRPHPPAGASTLIVSLGILSTPPQVASMVGAVLLVTVLGWGLNLLLGTRPVARPG
jgi:CBS-domain-containing membrane protein